MTKKLIITFRDTELENEIYEFAKSKENELGGKSGYIKRLLLEEMKRESK